MNGYALRSGWRVFEEIRARRAEAGPAWPTDDQDPPYAGVRRPRRSPVVGELRRDRQIRKARADLAAAEQIPWSSFVIGICLIGAAFVAVVNAVPGAWS